MQPSMFNLRVPLAAGDEVFLMNTLTDAQIVVSSDVVALMDRAGAGPIGDASDEEREALDVLWENGFLVENRDADRRSLDQYLDDVKSDTSELNVTLLTTLQCNFACEYCFQGDHGDYNERAGKMSLDTARAVVEWIAGELDRVRPGKLVLTFFGGEPLLNLPVMYEVAGQMWAATRQRQLPMFVNIITNGLLLTPEVVDRMAPLGLNGIKITLDGDRATHNRMRPLRGGQGTFDRIVENVRRVAGRCRISIGGNFDEGSVDSLPALLEFLKQQDFADKLAKVFFKPIVRAEPVAPKGVIPLVPIAATNQLNGTCMTSVGGGAGATRSLFHILDEKGTNVVRPRPRRRLRFVQRPRRQDDGSAPGNPAPGVSDARRRAQRSVPRAQTARAHHRTGRVAVSVSRVHRPTGALDRPHHRPAGPGAGHRPREIRPARSMEGLRRLRIHSGLRRRVRRGLPCAAWRHERADVSQAKFRIGIRFAGACRGQRRRGEVE
jgi:hypothetical protein